MSQAVTQAGIRASSLEAKRQRVAAQRLMDLEVALVAEQDELQKEDLERCEQLLALSTKRVEHLEKEIAKAKPLMALARRLMLDEAVSFKQAVSYIVRAGTVRMEDDTEDDSEDDTGAVANEQRTKRRADGAPAV